MTVRPERLSVSETARLLNVSPRTLYARMKWTENPLPSYDKAGQKLVGVMEAHTHCDTFGRRPGELRMPEGYGPQTSAESDITKDAQILAVLKGRNWKEIEPSELAMECLLAGIASDKIRSAVLVANAIQRQRESDARSGRAISPEDCIRMLQTHGDLIVEEIDANAVAFTSSLVKAVRESFGVDLAAQANAPARLESLYREQGNELITKIRARVDDQVRGIQRMEFT